MFRHRRRLCAEIKPKQPKKARQKVCCHFDILFIEIRALHTAWITKLASYYLPSNKVDVHSTSTHTFTSYQNLKKEIK